MENDVTRHVLSNGLTVLLKEVHNAPVISWWVLYRVGSRNEPTGKTGISHWVEHMMFKGTEEFPAGYLDKAMPKRRSITPPITKRCPLIGSGWACALKPIA